MDETEGRHQVDEQARNTDTKEGRFHGEDNDTRTKKDENVCERCGKTFKGRAGVKIHQGKKRGVDQLPKHAIERKFFMRQGVTKARMQTTEPRPPSQRKLFKPLPSHKRKVNNKKVNQQ